MKKADTDKAGLGYWYKGKARKRGAEERGEQGGDGGISIDGGYETYNDKLTV